MLKKVNSVTIKMGGIIMGLSYIPQIHKILTTKDVSGISLTFLMMVTIAVMTFTLDGYVVYLETGKRKTMVAQILNLIPALITVLLILIYR